MKKKEIFSGLSFVKKKEVAHPLSDIPADEIRMTIRNVEVDHIDPNPDQPRKTFEEKSLLGLAETIKNKGVLQPIIVHRAGEGRFRLVAGERRWRASKLAGKKTIPAIIKDEHTDDAEVSLIENIQRENLHPLEESCYIKNLVKDKRYKQKELAAIIGRDESYVSQSMKIADFAERHGDIKELTNLKNINGERLGRHHFMQAAYQPTYEAGISLLRKIVHENLTIKKIVSRKNNSISWDNKKASRHLKAVRKNLRFDYIGSLTADKNIIAEIDATKKHLIETAGVLGKAITSMEFYLKEGA